jgi:hypothetical protein
MPPELWKTTIEIWTDFDPEAVAVDTLGHLAMDAGSPFRRTTVGPFFVDDLLPGLVRGFFEQRERDDATGAASEEE